MVWRWFAFVLSLFGGAGGPGDRAQFRTLLCACRRQTARDRIDLLDCGAESAVFAEAEEFLREQRFATSHTTADRAFVQAEGGSDIARRQVLPVVELEHGLAGQRDPA